MLALLFASPALACGGLFCDANQPVDQSGEKILFVLDDVAGKVEVHVQISYTGPSEEFSWILPVPEEPELFLSVDDGLTRLANATNPTFTPITEQVGNCVSPPNIALSDSADTEESGGVTVTAEGQVGPYLTQTLQATDASVLVSWLTENGYDLPEGSEERIAPYISSGSYFVGLKLAKDRDAGDLAPFGVRYAGSDPVIPLQLTAVAATPDMRLTTMVLGPRRAVPENYLHVVVNEFAVDWLAGAANYGAVISAAADVAGGHAFATDFAGPVNSLPLSFWSEGQYPLEQVAQVTNAEQLASLLVTPNTFDNSWQSEPRFPISAGTLPILRRFVTAPQGVAIDDYIACIQCYDGAQAVDGVALAAALDAEWVTPMRAIQAHIGTIPYLTRMTSSISADEMTIDPRFTLNDTLGDVAAARQATLQLLCNGVHTTINAPRRLVLANGRYVDLPSAGEAAEQGLTWDQMIGDLAGLPAETVEQTGRSGEPVAIRSFTADIDAALLTINGCGCTQTGPGGLLVGGLSALALLRRRRGPAT